MRALAHQTVQQADRHCVAPLEDWSVRGCLSSVGQLLHPREWPSQRYLSNRHGNLSFLAARQTETKKLCLGHFVKKVDLTLSDGVLISSLLWVVGDNFVAIFKALFIYHIYLLVCSVCWIGLLVGGSFMLLCGVGEWRRSFLKTFCCVRCWVLPVMLTWSEGNSQLCWVVWVVLLWNKCLRTFFIIFFFDGFGLVGPIAAELRCEVSIT